MCRYRHIFGEKNMELVNGGELLRATGLRRGDVASGSDCEAIAELRRRAKAERPNPEPFAREPLAKPLTKADCYNEIIPLAVQAHLWLAPLVAVCFCPAPCGPSSLLPQRVGGKKAHATACAFREI